MSKHTPGGWSVVKYPDCKTFSIVNKITIGWFYAKDDAQLAASAPETLEALKYLERYYELLGTTGEFKTKLSALIAKAEGR